MIREITELLLFDIPEILILAAKTIKEDAQHYYIEKHYIKNIRYRKTEYTCQENYKNIEKREYIQ